MARITGLGGVFFRSRDPEKSYHWYETHLGVARDGPVCVFRWRHDDAPERRAMTIWAQHEHDTDYFGRPEQQVMINYRVDDLDALLAELRAAGVEVVPRTEESEYGKFGWIVDPDGNRVELWQPPKDNPVCY